MPEKERRQDEISREMFAESEANWQPYYEIRDELLGRHEWVKYLLEGGGESLSGFDPKIDFAKIEMNMRSSGVITASTPYHKRVEVKRFVHFTSFQVFKEIMNSGVIRLYNPHFGNDPNEVLFGSKERYNTDVDSEKNLKNLFILSMNEEEAKEDLTMWKLYGHAGAGVGLVLEFENPVEEWRNWYFGKVLYGNNQALEKLDTFHKDYKEVQAKMGPSPLLDIDIVPIYAFHKSGLFHSENEVRLLYYKKSIEGRHEYNKPAFPEGVEIKKTLNAELKDTYYLEYPVYWKQGEDLKFLSEYISGPRIRIKEVILGHKFKPEDAEMFETWCSDLMNNEYGIDRHKRRIASPIVSISPLHKYFKK